MAGDGHERRRRVGRGRRAGGAAVGAAHAQGAARRVAALLTQRAPRLTAPDSRGRKDRLI